MTKDEDNTLSLVLLVGVMVFTMVILIKETIKANDELYKVQLENKTLRETAINKCRLELNGTPN